jgi:predicted nucleic acid-binding protein
MMSKYSVAFFILSIVIGLLLTSKRNSDNGSFLLWMPNKYNVKNLILVAHDIPDSTDIVFQQFKKMTIKDSLNYPLARETGVKIILYQNGNNKVNGMIEESIAEMKNQFTR